MSGKANLKGTVRVDVDGTPWVLRCDFNALCDFEEITGKGGVDFIQEIEDASEGGPSPRMTDLRALMFAMLKQEQPDVTLAQAGIILGHHSDAVFEAIRIAFPAPEAGGGSEADGGTPPGEPMAAQG